MRQNRSAPPTDRGDAQGLDDAVSDRVGDCLFHLCPGRVRSARLALDVVAREGFEGETNGRVLLVGEVAQDRGREVPARTPETAASG